MLRRYRKGIALVLLISFTQEIFGPTTLFALTGGPSQPEVNSFEPVGTNQMVDLSTGDFNYNIPLMVVPGPNGGYPINLAYHAGIGMEQEASWVGLGWNINPGAITRSMRGVPDDFSGDKIKQTTNIKNDVTAGVSLDLRQTTGGIFKEIFGLDMAASAIPKTTFKIYYNNYRGVGYGVHPTPITILDRQKCGNKADSHFMGTIGFSFDSQTGIGMKTDFGLSREVVQNRRASNTYGYNVGFGINSRQGLTDIHFQRTKKHGNLSNRYMKYSSQGGSWNFASGTYVPETGYSMVGGHTQAGFLISKKEDYPNINKKLKVHVESSYNQIIKKERELEAYGAIYLEDQEGEGGAGTSYDRMMDMNVYNDVPISKRSVNMGVPVMTSDIFMVTGQGIGGSFRAHRNDVGKFYQAGNTSNTTSGNFSAPETAIGEIDAVDLWPGEDLGFITTIGFDFGAGHHYSYSGKWTGGELDLSFDEKNQNEPLAEPFYFKMAGEQTATELNEWNHLAGEDPVAFNMGFDWLGTSPKPIAKKALDGSGNFLKDRPLKKDRVKRLNSIQHSTNEEIVNGAYFSTRAKHIFEAGELPMNSADGEQIDYLNIHEIGSVDHDVDHHLQQYEIVKPDGTTYTYGLPAYNKVQEEVVFANTSSTGIADYTDANTVAYDPDDASLENDEGGDKYYSATEIPAYIHAHLLTEITSQDYVDLTGNGASEDDFGFYAKFNYQEVKDYEWRVPYENANYIKGYYSDPTDDKASFTYGMKNLYYVHSIETKTHIAVFELGDREDGLGVSDRNQNSGSASGSKNQKYLKKITLYSKNDPSMTPLQTVHFEYSYELCSGVPNNSGAAYDHDGDPSTSLVSNEGGKLTLKKVYITYNGNKKGRLSPYEFSYDGLNPSYDQFAVDRWGNYQNYATTAEAAIHPYVHQDDVSNVNLNASAWNLTNIQLPSGGEINVEYEADTYGYVQDQRAMEMVKVFGFTTTSNLEAPVDGETTADDRLKLKKSNLRLWFEIPNGFGTSDGADRQKIVEDYVEGIEEVYFKIYEELKLPHGSLGGDKAKDYVVGYAKVDNTSVGYDTDDDYGYIDLDEVTYRSVAANVFKTHPFRKAGWQYLRYQRPDLFHDVVGADGWAEDLGDAVFSIPMALGTAVGEVISTHAMGQYNKARILGQCYKMSDDKTSYIRLNSRNKKKYGGGYRIGNLSLSDNWIEGSRSYSTTYKYENADGSTSGVADYEPLIGGEENALKKPIWYNGNDQLLNFQHQDVYLETPLAEAVYPAPRVVYGRVLQYTTPESGMSKSQAGISVAEFYTAKDFPVYEKQTELKTTKGYNAPVYIPFVGLQTVQNNGYSQGYTVVLNDMSGKPKSMAMYPFKEETEGSGIPIIHGGDQAISKTEYFYKTDNKGKLDNKVTVLDEHGQTRTAIVGVEQDFIINEEQNNSYTEFFGENVQTETRVGFKIVTTPTPNIVPVSGLVVPSFNITANHSEQMYRGLSTSKIVYKSGLLDEVRVYSDGSTVNTKNLLYDAETGEALLTTVNNEWDKPVYSYNYAAHWAYQNMGGAYNNYGAEFYFEGNANELEILTTGSDVIPAEQVLTLGDEIQILESGTYNTYYVAEFNSSGQFTLEDEDGTSQPFISGANGKIIRSGYRNLQSVKSGSVVALNTSFLSANPGLFPLFSLWNSHITGADPQEGIDDPTYIDFDTGLEQSYTWNAASIFLPNYYDCPHQEHFNTVVSVDLATNQITFMIEGVCPAVCTLTFTDGVGDDTPMELGYISAITVADGSGGTVTSYTEQLVNFEIIDQEVDGTGKPTNVTLEYLPTGETFVALWETPSACLTYDCNNAEVLHADAITFSDDWEAAYPYIDLGDPEVSPGTTISDNDINKYRYGKKGVWRAAHTHLYQIDRKQEGVASSFASHINSDGIYSYWEPFDWSTGALNPNWDWVSEVTRYSPYGFALEEKSRLSTDLTTGGDLEIYSSQIYGYDNSLVIATASNASYFELGYTGFEQAEASEDLSNTGHMNLSTTGTYDVSSTKAHTGGNSLIISDAQEIDLTISDEGTSNVLIAKENKEYIVSLWVNVEEDGAVGTLSDGTNTVTTNDVREVIDGWKKLELKVTGIASGTFDVTYTSTGITHIDDVRFSPYRGGTVTYVYDRNNLWLLAELDGLNYATFYNYDEEGNLVQVKKETEKGIVTVQTARSNTRQAIP